MVTVAVSEGETAPDMFVLDMRDVPWDGSAGVTLTAAWDGHGMPATQSHAMAFNEFPVTRTAWPGQFRRIGEAPGGFTRVYSPRFMWEWWRSPLKRRASRWRDAGTACDEGRARRLADPAGLRGNAAGHGAGPRQAPARRASKDGDLGAGGVDLAADRQGYWRRDVLPVLALWISVRGCASARLFASPLGLAYDQLFEWDAPTENY